MTQRERVIKELRKGPATCGDIAAETGLERHVVSALLGQLHKRGRIARSEGLMRMGDKRGAYVYAPRTKSIRYWTNAELAALREMEGRSATEVARRLRRSVPSVRNFAREHGVLFVGGRVPHWPKRVKRLALGMRANGSPYRQISEATGVPLSTVKVWGRTSKARAG